MYSCNRFAAHPKDDQVNGRGSRQSFPCGWKPSTTLIVTLACLGKAPRRRVVIPLGGNHRNSSAATPPLSPLLRFPPFPIPLPPFRIRCCPFIRCDTSPFFFAPFSRASRAVPLSRTRTRTMAIPKTDNLFPIPPFRRLSVSSFSPPSPHPFPSASSAVKFSPPFACLAGISSIA